MSLILRRRLYLPSFFGKLSAETVDRILKESYVPPENTVTLADEEKPLPPLDEILIKARERFTVRYVEPSFRTLPKKLEYPPRLSDPIDPRVWKHQLPLKKFKIKDIDTPLGPGDAILTGMGFGIVVSGPVDVLDPRFVVILQHGNVVRVPKYAAKLRIPQLVSRDCIPRDIIHELQGDWEGNNLQEVAPPAIRRLLCNNLFQIQHNARRHVSEMLQKLRDYNYRAPVHVLQLLDSTSTETVKHSLKTGFQLGKPLPKADVHDHAIDPSRYVALYMALDMANWKLIKGVSCVKLPSKFTDTANLMKEYVAGNVEDSKHISLVAKKVREKCNDGDVTVSRVYDLFIKGNQSTTVADGERFSPADILALNTLAQNCALNLRNLEDQNVLYENVTADDTPIVISEDKNSIDYKRVDLSNLTAFCIDGPDAKEIDDAVSLVVEDDKTTLYVHVADPISMFWDSIKGENTDSKAVFEIAHSRAFTTYMPHSTVPMLPLAYTKKCDLGHDGVPTRALTFKITMIGKKFTAECFPSLLKSFKTPTYETVDNILENTTHPDYIALKQLYDLAEKLRNRRMLNGAVVYEDNGASKSQTLVSECMILANKEAAEFMAARGIPGVYRGYKSLPLTPKMEQVYKKMTFGKPVSRSDVAKLAGLLSSSYYSSDSATPHDMVGVPRYATVTSPLRRFCDLVNHMQLHNHYRDWELLTTAQCQAISLHCHSQAIVQKTSQRKFDTFLALQSLQIGDTVDVVVVSSLENGIARCQLDNAFAQLVIPSDTGSSTLLTDIHIGTHVTARVVKVDALASVCELEAIEAKM